MGGWKFYSVYQRRGRNDYFDRLYRLLHARPRMHVVHALAYPLTWTVLKSDHLLRPFQRNLFSLRPEENIISPSLCNKTTQVILIIFIIKNAGCMQTCYAKTGLATDAINSNHQILTSILACWNDCT